MILSTGPTKKKVLQSQKSISPETNKARILSTLQLNTRKNTAPFIVEHGPKRAAAVYRGLDRSIAVNKLTDTTAIHQPNAYIVADFSKIINGENQLHRISNPAKGQSSIAPHDGHADGGH